MQLSESAAQKCLQTYQIPTYTLTASDEVTLQLSIHHHYRFRAPVIALQTPAASKAADHAEAQVVIHPLLGLQDYQIRNLAIAMNIPPHYWKTLIPALKHLYTCYLESDATHLDINSFIITQQTFTVQNFTIHIDDNALFRHHEFADEYSPHEMLRLQGDIGCISNGSGTALALIDYLAHYGGQAGSFYDLSNTFYVEQIASALNETIQHAHPRVIICSLFSNLIGCDIIAQNLLQASEIITTPLIVRLAGNKSAQGLDMLRESGRSSVYAVDGLDEAARLAVSLRHEGE